MHDFKHLTERVRIVKEIIHFLVVGGSVIRKWMISSWRRLHSKVIIAFLITGGSTGGKKTISLLEEAPQ